VVAEGAKAAADATRRAETTAVNFMVDWYARQMFSSKNMMVLVPGATTNSTSCGKAEQINRASMIF
jgi:hypothetical protein